MGDVDDGAEVEEVEGDDAKDDSEGKRKKRKVTYREVRKVPVPPHRYTPLKDQWPKIVFPIVKQLHLQVR